jgi:hypothetical protein
MIPVKDNPHLFKYGNTIVNNDSVAREAYLKRKNAVNSQRSEVDSMKQSINNLDNRMTNIEESLSKILSLLQK